MAQSWMQSDSHSGYEQIYFDGKNVRKMACYKLLSESRLSHLAL